MRVLINALSVKGERSGIGHYTSELIRCLQPSPDFRLDCYPGNWLGRLGRHLLNDQSRRYEADRVRSGFVAFWKAKLRGKAISVVRKVARALLLNPLENRDETYQLYHEPNYLPLESNIPTVTSVHDLSVLQHPEWHPPKRIDDFTRMFAEGLKRCRHLIAISEFGRQQIIRHLGWDPNRVSVTYMGIRPGLRPLSDRQIAPVLQRLGLDRGYLLHVGTMEPRKNLRMLIEVYSALPGAIRERHPLVLVGGRGWNSDELHHLLTTEGKARNIRYLGYAREDHLAALYNGARALVFPTFYEGFGIPTIEMLACGGAVLASTAGAVAETVGEQAHLIDPSDRDGWRDALLRVCSDEDWWRQLRHGATTTAARYSWERCAAETLTVYRQLCDDSSASKAA